MMLQTLKTSTRGIVFFSAVLLLFTACSVGGNRPKLTQFQWSSNDLVQDADGNMLSLSCLRANAGSIQLQGRKAALQCRTGKLQLSYPISSSY